MKNATYRLCNWLDDIVPWTLTGCLVALVAVLVLGVASMLIAPLLEQEPCPHIVSTATEWHCEART